MFRYRLYSPDRDEIGEATYAMMIQPGEEILYGNGRRFLPLDDDSPFVGPLQVEAVGS